MLASARCIFIRFCFFLFFFFFLFFERFLPSPLPSPSLAWIFAFSMRLVRLCYHLRRYSNPLKFYVVNRAFYLFSTHVIPPHFRSFSLITDIHFESIKPNTKTICGLRRPILSFECNLEHYEVGCIRSCAYDSTQNFFSGIKCPYDKT